MLFHINCVGSHEHACLCKCVWARPRGIGGVRGISENCADFMGTAGFVCAGCCWGGCATVGDGILCAAWWVRVKGRGGEGRGREGWGGGLHTWLGVASGIFEV